MVSTKYIAPYKGIRYLESGEILLVIRDPESGKLFFLKSGILGFGIRNKAQGIRNPLRIGIRNPSCSGLPGNPQSKNLESEIHGLESRIQHCRGFSYSGGGDKTGFSE